MPNQMKLITFAVLNLVAIADSHAITHAIDTGIQQIIANPARFEGRRVRVAGFMHLQFEGEALYMREQDYISLLFKNGVWLDLSESQTRRALPLNDHYVTIEGTFYARERGHFSLWSGSIKKINKLTATKPSVIPGVVHCRDSK